MRLFAERCQGARVYRVGMSRSSDPLVTTVTGAARHLGINPHLLREWLKNDESFRNEVVVPVQFAPGAHPRISIPRLDHYVHGEAAALINRAPIQIAIVMPGDSSSDSQTLAGTIGKAIAELGPGGDQE